MENNTGITPSNKAAKKLKEDTSAPAPTKTIQSLNEAREKKKNENNGVLLMHKTLAKTVREKKST